jgi:hypothetical protein
MAILEKILSWLPFNGDKTKLGMLLTVITFVQAILSTQDGQLLVSLVQTKPINYIAIATILVGILHKYLKAQSAA